MTLIEDFIEILAPTTSVWRVISDPTYIPKLYKDAISVELDPPGPLAVGQKIKVHGRAQSVRVASTVEITKVEKERFFEARESPGEMFSRFSQTVTLVQKGWDTEAKISIDFELRPEFRAKVPDPAMVERMLDDSFRWYARNLKELSELIPLPE